MSETVTLYVDYRSPYSYLVKDDAYRLETDFDVGVDWYPLCIDLAGAHGTPQSRNAREWAKVKYLYMDCRRIANKRGLIVKGTQKIYDPTLISLAMLWIKRYGRFRPFHDAVLARFWQREFDIEDAASVRRAISEAGVPLDGFDAYVQGEGHEQFGQIQRQAEAQGVFGVPTFVFRDELFWGTDRVGMLRERLQEAGLGRGSRAAPLA